MSDLVLDSVTSGYNLSLINNNFQAIQDRINDYCLQNKEGRNVLNQDLDINGHALLNVDSDFSNSGSLLTVGDAKTHFYQVGLVPAATGDSDAVNYGQVAQMIEASAVGTDPFNVALYSVLASNVNGSGASLVGISDVGSLYAATTVEGALAEVITKSNAAQSQLDAIQSDLDTAFGTGLDFVQTGTGAVARPYLSKVRERVSVQDFGAVGNNIVDDTLAIQKAIDSGAGTVNLGDGYTYKVSKLTGRANLKLVGNSTLDFSANAGYSNLNTTGPLFSIEGTAGPVILLTANAVLNASTLTVASTAGISAGDIIEIATPGTTGDFVDTSTTVNNGELLQVASVDSATQLTLSDPIVDEFGYSVANAAQIRKINTVDNIYIGDGVRMVGKGRSPVNGESGDSGISIVYGRNVLIHKFKIERVDSTAIGLNCCYNSVVSNSVVRHDAKGTPDTINYGITLSNSCKHIRVHDNHLSNMRHAIVTSHQSSSLGLNRWGVNRCIQIYNNTILNTWHGAVATHNDADRIKIFNNTMIGCAYGCNIRERNVDVYDNKFINCGQGVYLSAQPRNISIYDNHGVDGTGSLVFSDFTGASRTISDIKVYNNVSERTPGGIFVSGAGSIRWSITGNKIRNCTGPGGSAFMIRFVGTTPIDLIIKDNEILDCTGTGGISVGAGGTNTLILNNNVIGVSGTSLSLAGTFTNSYAKGNMIKSSSGQTLLTNTSTFTSDNTVNTNW